MVEPVNGKREVWDTHYKTLLGFKYNMPLFGKKKKNIAVYVSRLTPHAFVTAKQYVCKSLRL